MKFTIVIPVHNEAENIGELAHDITTSIKGDHQYEILFVDDHSIDRTPVILRELTEKLSNMRFLRLSKQSGQSGALHTGIQAARYPIIVTLDGDGQNDPQDIEAFLNCFHSNQHTSQRLLVNGHRTDRHDSGWRLFSSGLANRVRNILLKDSTRDSGCGIKAFPKNLFLKLPHFNHMHRFLPALVLQHGGEVINLPVHHRKRSHGQSKYGTFDRLFCGIFDLLGVMWLSKRTIHTEIEHSGSNNG